ncbi:hypothetical protein PM8797T_21938 [Gimesia maris DSM 8797]|nr:hypothetical protein PM8797T_21938 [Gimesia maris DSM 8797]
MLFGLSLSVTGPHWASCSLQIILVVREIPAYNALICRHRSGFEPFEHESLEFISDFQRNECYIEGTGYGNSV